MNRRDFLRRCALIAAGAVAADQMDLLDRLGWRRRFFPGFGDNGEESQYLTDGRGNGIHVTKAQWDVLLRDAYMTDVLTLPIRGPFSERLRRRAPRSLLTPSPVWSGKALSRG